MASALRLLQLDLLEAEVEYANRKSVLLFRALNPVDGDSECAADEIGASARSPFARLRFASRRVTPAGQVLHVKSVLDATWVWRLHNRSVDWAPHQVSRVIGCSDDVLGGDRLCDFSRDGSATKRHVRFSQAGHQVLWRAMFVSKWYGMGEQILFLAGRRLEIFSLPNKPDPVFFTPQIVCATAAPTA